MSAYEEMSRSGAVGRETFAAFAWAVSSVARRYGFPPPQSATKWTHAACEEWVQNLFAQKGHELAVKLYAQATDEASFARLVRRAVENALKDEAKATTAGKIRSRMRTLLSSEPDFSDATALYGGDAAWTFAEFGEAIYSGDWQDLLSAPELKAIEPIKALNTAGKTSKENADKLVGAARIILRRAGGAMRDQVLAYALVTLFELDAPDMFLMRDDDVQEKPGKIADSPEGRVEAIEAADDIIMQLSPNQCMALIVLDQPIAMARASLPPIPNLESFLEDLRARMREILDPTDLPPGAMDYVLRHARKLRDQVEI